MKIAKDIKQHLIELLREHYKYKIVPKYIDLFETIYNEHDEYFINQKINQCCKWTLRKDDNEDKFNKKIKRDEQRILERIAKRIKKLK